MKFLTTITIVMAIPTMVFSAYGMNLNLSGIPFSVSHDGFLIVIDLSGFKPCGGADLLQERSLDPEANSFTERGTDMNFLNKMEESLADMRSIIFLPISLPFMWQAIFFLYFFAPASIFSYLTLRGLLYSARSDLETGDLDSDSAESPVFLPSLCCFLLFS